jgi:integrase
MPAAEFGPKRLKAVRQKMLDMGWCRTHTNHQVNRVKRMFKWAVGEELVPPDLYYGLQAIPGIRKGTITVRESEPIKPVPETFVNATLPFMPPVVATMVRLQLLTSFRPGEICILRTCDLDVTGKVWIYRPKSHKTQHHGHERLIFIGPKGQELLRPWLRPELEAYVFSPVASEEARNTERRLGRKTPITPSQAKRKRTKKRHRP